MDDCEFNGHRIKDELVFGPGTYSFQGKTKRRLDGPSRIRRNGHEEYYFQPPLWVSVRLNFDAIAGIDIGEDGEILVWFYHGKSDKGNRDYCL